MARCKYGKLKNPSGKRRCKRKVKSGHRVHARRGGKCRYGKLKSPKGARVCRRKRGGGKRRMSRAAQEAYMWKSYQRQGL